MNRYTLTIACILSSMIIMIEKVYACVNELPTPIISGGDRLTSIGKANTFSGSNSFDGDNVPEGEDPTPGIGITKYWWNIYHNGFYVWSSGEQEASSIDVTFNESGYYSAALWVKGDDGEDDWTPAAFESAYVVWIYIASINITTETTTAMDITNVPAMPSVTFQVDMEPAWLVPYTAFKWYLQMSFTHDTLGALGHRVPSRGTDSVTGTAWSPNWGSLLAGGNVTVYVEATCPGILSGSVTDNQGGYHIRGTNPTQAQIFAIASSSQAKAVCWKESSHRQFSATAYSGIDMPLPSYAHDGGYGLMQITPANEGQVWNWTANLNAGISLLNTEYNRSVQHVSNINTPGIAPNPDPTPNPPLSLTTSQHWLNALSRYRSGTYYYGYQLVSGTQYQWIRNDGTGSDYADDIIELINDPPWSE